MENTNKIALTDFEVLETVGTGILLFLKQAPLDELN